jgi:hypothetical protein
MGLGKRRHNAGQGARSDKRSSNNRKLRGFSKSSVGARGLRIEALEDRRLLAVYTVTNLSDLEMGDVVAGSLRAAINNANGGDPDEMDFVVFADNVAGTITLNGGQFNITQQMRIIGPGPMKVGIQAQNNRRLFDINVGAEDEFFPVEISGLTLQGGAIVTGAFENQLGGAIWNRENLNMTEVVLSNNVAGRGGGAIYHEVGTLRMQRSYVSNNSAGIGGAIQIGPDGDADEVAEIRPGALIVNSTFFGNSAGSHGGAIALRQGRLDLANNTIVSNTAGGYGAGVASWGNLIPANVTDEEYPAATNLTRVTSNIIYDNTAMGDDPLLGTAGDIDSVGTGVTTMQILVPAEPTDPPTVPPPDPTMEDVEVPLPLFPSIQSGGFNMIESTNVPFVLADYLPVPMPPSTLVPPPMRFEEPFNVDPWQPNDQFGVDPMLSAFPTYFGGSTPVLLPAADSPAIDMGSAAALGGGFASSFDQRGRHFTRFFGMGVDVGAAERQNGVFIVDNIVDESDSQFSMVDPTVGIGFGIDPYLTGDFALREAIAFSEANPEVDTILFVDFRDDTLNPDPTVTPAPTIYLTGGPLQVASSVFIQGPSNYVLEVDGSGNDLTPQQNNSDGERVFEITNGNNATFTDISISNLSIMGADMFGNGGGILNRENLTLAGVTLRDNNASARGGAVYTEFGTLSLSNSTVNGNRAGDDGAGLFINGAATGPFVTIESSTFSGNIAGDRGAGITNNNGDLTIRYSTITANTSGSSFASGIANFGAAASTTLYSTIVAGNSSSNRDIEFYSLATIDTFVSEGYNFIGNGNAASKFSAASFDLRGTNPMLAPLANTGGLTATHRPLPGSPVIDAGSLNPVTPPMTDQRGGSFVRIFDGDFDSVDRIDIGAYELQAMMLLVDTGSNVSNGDFSQGNLSLREAIEISNNSPLVDTIMFAPNVSVISFNSASEPTMTINQTVHIVGPGSEELRIELFPVDLIFQPSLADRIFTIDNGAASLIDVDISGLEIRNAQIGAIHSRENLVLDDIVFINNRNTTAGGAVFHELGSFKLSNSVVTGNATTAVNADGGAIYLRNVNGAAIAEFEYVTISGNTTAAANSDGAGVFVKNSTVEFRNVTISGNATLGGTADAGGIYVDGGSVLFEESTISGNSTTGANSEGGGMFVNGGIVTLAKSTALNFNSTVGTQSTGGGAFVAGGTLNIENSLVLSNTTAGISAHGGGLAVTNGAINLVGTSVLRNRASGAGANGGGIANLSGTVLVRDSTVAENLTTSANSNGGGVYSDTNLTGTQTTTLLNSTISGNSSTSRGGGVFNADGAMVIRHSTITNNSTPYLNTGNGVASLGNAATSISTRIESSIIAGNVGSAAGTGSDVDFVDAQFLNSFVSDGYNVIGTGNALAKFDQPGDKIGITNPLLSPLAANGGLTDTHALLDGSAAINAGKPSFNASNFSPPLSTDQRGVGFARVLGGRIDAGAFESSSTPFSADFDLDGDVDGGDFLVWQRFNGLMAGATKSQGDANADGKVNGADLTIWRSQIGAGGSGAAAPASEGSSSPAIAAAVVAAPDEDAAEPEAIVASAPVAVVAFEATTSVTAIASKVSDSSPASPDFGSIASAGVPGMGSARRTAHRPAVARGSAHDAVHASAESHFTRRLASSTTSATFESRLGEGATLSECESELEAEDSVFAMLGDGTL